MAASGVAAALVALALLWPAAARASEGELGHRSGASRPLQLITPDLLALPPSTAALIAGPPVLAKRARKREFDTSMGEVDPRVRQLPRTHRFRLTLHASWVRLSRTLNPATEEYERFHFAPMMLDLGYQAQFLKYVMVRIAVAVGGNVANTRNAMPLAVFPQAYVGYQGKVLGVAFGYGFDWTIPPVFGASASTSTALEQPVITRNHVVMGELGATTRVDRVALTFSLAIGGIQSDLSHFQTSNRKFRPYLGFQFGAFFDGTIRREKKARKRAETKG